MTDNTCREAFYRWIETQDTSEPFRYEKLYSVWREGAAWNARNNEGASPQSGLAQETLCKAKRAGDYDKLLREALEALQVIADRPNHDDWEMQCKNVVLLAEMTITKLQAALEK